MVILLYVCVLSPNYGTFGRKGPALLSHFIRHKMHIPHPTYFNISESSCALQSNCYHYCCDRVGISELQFTQVNLAVAPDDIITSVELWALLVFHTLNLIAS